MSAIGPEEQEAAARAQEEAQEAAAEAAGIGGRVTRDTDDPAEQPVIESGEGESEGFELAERDLRTIAEHGDERNFPDGLAPPPEERSAAEYGEADQTTPADE